MWCLLMDGFRREKFYGLVLRSSTKIVENLENPRKAMKNGEELNRLEISHLQHCAKLRKSLKINCLELEDRCSIH